MTCRRACRQHIIHTCSFGKLLNLLTYNFWLFQMKFKDKEDGEQENKDIVQSQVPENRRYNSAGKSSFWKKKNQLFSIYHYCSIIIAVNVMEQVAAVLDALSDAKETTRQQVIGLVERIALRLEKVESKNQQLVQENESLKDQLNMVGCSATLIGH